MLHAQSVGSNSDYVNALSSINSAVTGGTGNSYSLEFNSGLSVTPGTGAFINAGTGNMVSINGNGGSLNGGNTLTPAVIFSGTVNLSNLDIENGMGQGGSAGWNRAEPAGGGGAGLGGGLFIATSSVVSLNNVSVTNNSTRGGRSTGGAVFSGGNASFVLGLSLVDSNGVPTTGSGNPIYGRSVMFGGAGTSGGGQQSLSYIGGAGYLEDAALETNGTTGSTYDGGGGGGFISSSAAYGGIGKMGGGDGSGDAPFGVGSENPFKIF